MVTFPSNSFSYLYSTTEELAKPIELSYEQSDLEIVSIHNSSVEYVYSQEQVSYPSFQYGKNKFAK